MKFLNLSALVLAGSLMMGSTMAAAADPARFEDGFLVGPNGMALYTFDKDTPDSGKSVCNGQCAINWPPLFAAETDMPAGDYTIITRDDGKLMWAFKGKPLYYWIKDKTPADHTGEAVPNWKLIRS